MLYRSTNRHCRRGTFMVHLAHGTSFAADDKNAIKPRDQAAREIPGLRLLGRFASQVRPALSTSSVTACFRSNMLSFIAYLPIAISV
jgi:hypothetical protein